MPLLGPLGPRSHGDQREHGCGRTSERGLEAAPSRRRSPHPRCYSQAETRRGSSSGAGGTLAPRSATAILDLGPRPAGPLSSGSRGPSCTVCSLPARAMEVLRLTTGASTTPMLSCYASVGGRNPLSTFSSGGGAVPFANAASTRPIPSSSCWVPRDTRSFGSSLAAPAATICRPPNTHPMCGVLRVHKF